MPPLNDYAPTLLFRFPDIHSTIISTKNETFNPHPKYLFGIGI